MFWVLNGLDKFFNGKSMSHDVWGRYSKGWFGVNRDEKFVHYFERLDLPREMAICSLYGFATLEIILGIAFFTLLFKFTPKVVHRTCFKSSVILFIIFMTGDILFGDRMELWEHGTFMILVIITFQLYLDRALIRREVLKELGIDVKGPTSGPLMGLNPGGPGQHSTKASVTREFNLALDRATGGDLAQEEPTTPVLPVQEPSSTKTVLIEHRRPKPDSDDSSG